MGKSTSNNPLLELTNLITNNPDVPVYFMAIPGSWGDNEYELEILTNSDVEAENSFVADIEKVELTEVIKANLYGTTRLILRNKDELGLIEDYLRDDDGEVSEEEIQHSLKKINEDWKRAIIVWIKRKDISSIKKTRLIWY